MKTITFKEALRKLAKEYGKIWDIEFEYHKADKEVRKTPDIAVWSKSDKHCFYDTDLIQDFLGLGFYVIIEYSIVKDRIEILIYK
jgi:hypothetical protein